MVQIVIWVVAGLSAFNLVILVLVLKRLAFIKTDAAEQAGQDGFQSFREEMSKSEREIRNEIRASQETTANTLMMNIGEFSKTLTAQVEGMRSTVDERFRNLQQSNDNKLVQVSQTVTEQLQSTADTLVNTVGELGKSQDSQLESVRKTVHERLEAMQNSNEDKSEQMYKTVTDQLQSTADTLVNTVGELGKSQDSQLESVRKTVHERLEAMQTSNEDKSEQMHKTVTNQLQSTADTLVNTVGELGKSQDSQLESVRKTVHERLEAMQTSNEDKSEQMYKTVTEQLQSTADTLVNTVGELGKSQDSQLESVRKTVHERLEAMQTSNEDKSEQMHKTVTNQLQSTADTLVSTVGELGKSQDSQLENVRKTVHERLEAVQTSNEEKLDQMRQTVDEQLQSTLESRLGESFKIVNRSLEDVQRGLGEMQSLATGVGDLKRVLTNVKARGTWGEVQLGSLLQEVLTPDQYGTNVRLHDNSHEEVEYAIRLPGSNDGPDSCIWLPIDSKFPLADYDRLVDASDASDVMAVQEATQAFMRAVRAEAKKIQDKYISPPKTTDFAIMFLPTEGLYAEVLRAPGRVTELLQRYRIVVAGPTTLAAILSSLRMGFRTLAIEKRSSEVWEILAAVKTEFGKFGSVMDKLKRQLNTASKTIDETGVRTRAMERNLREVEELPQEAAAARLGLPNDEQAISWDSADD